MISLGPFYVLKNYVDKVFHTCSALEKKIELVVQSSLLQLGAACTANILFQGVMGSFAVATSVHFFTTFAAAVFAALLVVCIVGRVFGGGMIRGSSLERIAACLEDFGGRLARVSLLNTLTLKLNHYIHEGGHALAALMSFVKANPRITATWRGGFTVCAISHGLTLFGKFLGEHGSLLFFAAGGLIATVLCATGEFACAHWLKDNYPMLSELLTCHGLSQLAEAGVYGFSAFFTNVNNMEHDFIRIWTEGGVHPAISLALILIPPFLIPWAWKKLHG